MIDCYCLFEVLYHILCLRLNIYDIQLQSRIIEVEKTETALWHWSLNLQAKVMPEHAPLINDNTRFLQLHNFIVCSVCFQVFCVWRLWIAERQRKQNRLTEAAQFYRDELLREGVTHILTHTAHMNAFSTNIAQHSYEQVHLCISV